MVRATVCGRSVGPGGRPALMGLLQGQAAAKALKEYNKEASVQRTHFQFGIVDVSAVELPPEYLSGGVPSVRVAHSPGVPFTDLPVYTPKAGPLEPWLVTHCYPPVVVSWEPTRCPPPPQKDIQVAVMYAFVARNEAAQVQRVTAALQPVAAQYREQLAVIVQDSEADQFGEVPFADPEALPKVAILSTKACAACPCACPTSTSSSSNRHYAKRLGGIRCEGGGLFESRQPPPPPSRPPKVLEPGFQQFEILGKTVGTGNFFLASRGQITSICFFPDVSILKLLRILWRITPKSSRTRSGVNIRTSRSPRFGWGPVQPGQSVLHETKRNEASTSPCPCPCPCPCNVSLPMPLPLPMPCPCPCTFPCTHAYARTYPRRRSGMLSRSARQTPRGWPRSRKTSSRTNSRP